MNTKKISVLAIAKGLTPPVFIVVCNNTSVSKMVFDWIAGWDTEKTDHNGKPVLAKGKLDLFSNVERGRWTPRLNTILVDSEQLESGETMTAEFKRLAAQEIEEFKAEYRDRYPGDNGFVILNSHTSDNDELSEDENYYEESIAIPASFESIDESLNDFLKQTGIPNFLFKLYARSLSNSERIIN